MWYYNYFVQKNLVLNENSLKGLGYINDVYVKSTESDSISLVSKRCKKASCYLFDKYHIE